MQCAQAGLCSGRPCSAFTGWQYVDRPQVSNTCQHASAALLNIAPLKSTCMPGHNRRQQRQRGGLLILAAIKRKSDKHFICAKQVIATPGTEEEVQQLCRGVLDFSQARMKEKDSGIVSFEVSQDLNESNVFHFWERYESNSQMGKHNTCPEMTKFLEDVVELTQEPVGMALYEMKDGQLSNTCVQGGPKGEGGLDDASGGNGGAGGASMKQSSAVVDLGKQERGDGDTAWGMSLKFPWQKDD